MDETAIETEIQAKGLNAPRLTPEFIDGQIAAEYWFTAWDAVSPDAPKVEALKALTICVLVLKNGFTVTGESACASLENFDADIGRKIARSNARDKIWALEGYLLKTQLSNVAFLSRPGSELVP